MSVVRIFQIAKELNISHTDILSFPYNQEITNFKEVYLGDIIISFNYIYEIILSNSFRYFR